MTSSSSSFGNDPDGYGPEPRLSREEILAAVTSSSVARTITGTSSSGSHRSDSLVDSDTRPGDWCECGNCEPSSEMRRVECLCRADAVLPVHQYAELRRESQTNQPYICVTDHRREFGRTLPGSWDHNTKIRYIAYREFIKFAYGTLGRRIRKVIPACVVKIIRQKFPKLAGMNYIGFHY